ncbi:TonB-dependent receptor [Brevundimonas sp. A19_0]|uniref:TonB-dependent receptor domain-containing protein n=1 Tax=Brevundimonas sp. A19_0 TaxID=2821087 RepID=UPI001ADCF481|nr:TonB-dependent receptor [Brevundimonas sp. A19_0]MBO9500320.1 TonB-dependent receptor [Brevundimonas sp. A19_0]
MKTLSLTLSGLLLASTALIAPGVALAQQQDPVPAQSDAQDPQQEAQVDEIVVLGRYIPEPLRETSEVASFVTREDLQRTGDDDAAAALTRVTGLSVVEGRFVYVRGLGERYSSALLNGSPLPSPEPLQRVVPLDLFPSSALDGVTVQKTYSANYPGEFGGGVIDLQTITAPREPFLTISASIGGNLETTGREGYIYYGSRTDFTGFDDGTRDVPGLLRDAIATGNRVATGANFTSADIQAIGRDFVNAPLNLLQTQDYIQPNFGLDIAGGRSWDVGAGLELGLVFVAGYDNNWRTRTGIQQEGRLDVDQLVVQTNYDYVSTENDIGLNFLGGLSLGNENHQLKWTNLYVRNVTKEARTREGVDFAAPGTGEVRDDYTEWFERSLFTSQLAGTHWLMNGDLELSWRGAYARTDRDAPYEKVIRYRLDPDGVYRHDTEAQRNSTSFSELEDEIVSGGADFAWTTALSSVRDMTVRGGVAYSDNTRNAERRDFRFYAPNGLPLDVQDSRVDYLFSDFNLGPALLELQEITPSGGAAAYEAGLETQAAYLQVEAEIVPLVSVSAGVRYEDATQFVTPIDLFGGALVFQPTELQNSYWLPSATLTWNFAEDMQLRLGASKTIGRPQFRELAPQQYLDPDNDRLFFGNPYLVDTELVNLDARVEWYFARGQYVTGGVFYKDIENPIESTINDIGSVIQQTYLNAPNATLMGFEVDAKKYWEMPDHSWSFIANKRWLVQANYTFTDSEVNVDAGDTVRVLSAGGAERPASDYIIDGSRMQGQSEHLANLQLGWEDDMARSQATILVTWVSERSSARGRPGEPDLIQEPGVMLDFVYRKDFEWGGRDMGLAIELRNLLDEEYLEYQELGNRITANGYDLGQSGSISLTTRF